jgi:Copper amine oxidase, enzyme domain
VPRRWYLYQDGTLQYEVKLTGIIAPEDIAPGEDWPVMPVEVVGFSLKPAGFFDGNPALDVAATEHSEHASQEREQPDVILVLMLACQVVSKASTMACSSESARPSTNAAAHASSPSAARASATAWATGILRGWLGSGDWPGTMNG